MLSIRSLFESSPQHPDTIIIKNEFYPEGLTQLDIYNYYLSNKKNILMNTSNRDLLFFFATDTNKFIVKRKVSDGYHKLTNKNYEDILSGRTVSIHNTMNETENFGIIDIDSDDFDKCKQAIKDIYPIFPNSSIYFSGKSSFHIHISFNKYSTPMDNKKYIKDILTSKNLSYNIDSKRISGQINLDLSSNKFRGGFICPYSLSILGLRSIPIDIKHINSFKKESAKI